MNSATPYEALGPDRFQLFGQALMSFEHEDLQTFPLHQADGGRDATAMLGRDGYPLLVYQFKFAERPDAIDDPAGWLQSKVNEERPKIERLAEGGARLYRLVTNVRGSGALDRGQMDRVATVLRSLPMRDALCLWRNDLDIRLAKHPVLKWTFRELLTGQDVLDELLFSGLTEDRDRRERALRAFLAAQAAADRVVRFRQVDLRNELLDLWVDVPAAGLSIEELERIDPRASISGRERTLGAEPEIGMAEVLLNATGPGYDRVRVHGGPGQGKSTLAQYVCQVHRMRLLDGAAADARLGAHAASQLRLPLRVELTQLGQFLSGADPFRRKAELQPTTPRTLDGFLAHMVSSLAGGDLFTVSDLKACLAMAPTLLVLDGLDEVADADQRAAVVEAIEAGAITLSAVAPGRQLRIVVTSRPTAFVRFADLGPDWLQLSLRDLPRETIETYTRAWTRVQRLTDDQTEDLVELLADRLGEPHFADLARNPMQLTIVLSLLQVKGDFLPDRRTQLYAEYMNYFLAREAEKSKIVANHAELLFNLHGHLAFRMHSAAEHSPRGGRIAATALRKEIAGYLAAAEADPALLDELFVGVVQRVMALVSRVEGWFVFEVQPLREFFAGHHLHDSAPVARYGEPQAGTLPDRFDALVRNPYWLNVLRFFAGRYASMALSSLADGLVAFHRDPTWAATDHPRLVSTLLLSDKVFTLNAPARSRVVANLLGEIPHRHALESSEPSAGRLAIADEPAAVLLVEHVLDQLSGPAVPFDRRQALAEILHAHADFAGTNGRWRARVEAADDPARRHGLLLAGCHAGLLHACPEQARSLLTGVKVDAELARWLLVNVPHVVEGSSRLSALAVEGVLLAGFPTFPFLGLGESSLARWAFLFEAAAERGASIGDSTMQPGEHPVRANRHVDAAFTMLTAFDKRRGHGYGAGGGRWDTVVEDARRHFGDHVGLTSLAISLVDQSDETFAFADKIVRDDAPIVERALRARRNMGATLQWWSRQLGLADTAADRILLAASILKWDPGRLIERHASFLASTLEGLDDAEMRCLFRALRAPTDDAFVTLRPAIVAGFAAPVQLAAALRMPGPAEQQILDGLVDALPTLRPPVAELLGDRLLELLVHKGSPHGRDAVRQIYAKCPEWDSRSLDVGGGAVPLSEAREILSNPERYPLSLVALMEQAGSVFAREHVDPLIEEADKLGWWTVAADCP